MARRAREVVADAEWEAVEGPGVRVEGPPRAVEPPTSSAPPAAPLLPPAIGALQVPPPLAAAVQQWAPAVRIVAGVARDAHALLVELGIIVEPPAPRRRRRRR